MKSEIISTNARIINAEGFQIASGVEVETYVDQDGDKFYRIGGTLHLSWDVIVGGHQLTLLATNCTVLL